MTKDEIVSCTSCNENPLISLREKKSSLRIENPNRKKVNIIRIDSCIKSIQDTIKCDYGAYDQNNFFFIELKGSDIKHGVEQLESSLRIFSSFFSDRKKSCVLCATRIPRASTEPYEIKKKFYSKNKVPLLITDNIKFL